MAADFPFDLLEEPSALAVYQGWSEEVYRDLLAFQRGELTEAAVRGKYGVTRAVLIADLTGFTEAAIKEGELNSLSRILDAQKVIIPALRDCAPVAIRVFADDFYATFAEPEPALDAALEIHRRVEAFNNSPLAGKNPARCCIGLGYGRLLRMGLDQAMGDEMNRASKLGEDTAAGGETLVTESFYHAVSHRPGCQFEPRRARELPFPYYAVFPEPWAGG